MRIFNDFVKKPDFLQRNPLADAQQVLDNVEDFQSQVTMRAILATFQAQLEQTNLAQDTLSSAQSSLEMIEGNERKAIAHAEIAEVCIQMHETQSAL